MKTYREILKDLISDLVSAQDKVTYFGKDGVARAIFHSVANTLNDIWNDVYQSKRKMQVETSEGADLDLVGFRHGLTRKGATKSSVVLLFNGLPGTVIPAGTAVRSPVTMTTYLTKNTIVLGTINPAIQRPIYSDNIGDVVLAESIEEGSQTKVGIDELTELETPIEGVTVTNMVMSEGGLDRETDEQFRYRIMHNVSLLAHGTDDFYRELARESDPTVLRSYVKYNPLDTGVLIYVVKDSGAQYTEEELSEMADYVYDRQRALQPVRIMNAEFFDIEIYFQGKLGAGYTKGTMLNDLCTRLAEYVDWSKLDFGATLSFKYISELILDTDSLSEINLNSIKVNESRKNVNVPSFKLPRLTKISFYDGGTTVNLPVTSQFIRA